MVGVRECAGAKIRIASPHEVEARHAPLGVRRSIAFHGGSKNVTRPQLFQRRRRGKHLHVGRGKEEMVRIAFIEQFFVGKLHHFNAPESALGITLSQNGVNASIQRSS